MNIHDNAALKNAFDEDVTKLGGPTAVAAKTRVDQARISRYCSLSDQNITTHAPIDVIMDVARELMRRGAMSRALEVMADQLGLALVHKEEAERRPDLAQHVGTVAKEAGEAVSALAVLIDPAARTPENLERAHREIHEAEVRLAEADEVVSALESKVVRIRGVA